MVKVYSDGTCNWWPLFDLSESHCNVEVTWFPFDSQTCQLIYELFRHTTSDVNMTSVKDGDLTMNEYEYNDQWELLGL